MQRFAQLLADLAADPAGPALADWFGTAPLPDRVWALALLTGRAPPRLITQARLRALAQAACGLPDWLWAESQAASGDGAEVAALLVPPATHPGPDGLAAWMDRLATLRALPAADLPAAIARDWACQAQGPRVLWNRLLTGRFRAPVTQAQTLAAVAQVTGLPLPVLAGRLGAGWDPARTTWGQLTQPPGADDAAGPLPFARLDLLQDAGTLPDTAWRADLLWPGPLVQLVLQGGRPWLWQDGGALITADHAFLTALATRMPPDAVIEGQIVDGIFHPLDLLALGAHDLRPEPLATRLHHLAGLALPQPAPLTGAPLADLRARALQAGAQALLLRDPACPRGAQPDGWLWRADPLRLTAVLLYAHSGQGSALPAEFTLALPDDTGALIPVARTGQGLAAADLRALGTWARANTVQRFGPVRQLAPGQIVELACDGVTASGRHKAGLTLLNPRIARWHRDGGPAPTALATLRARLG